MSNLIYCLRCGQEDYPDSNDLMPLHKHPKTGKLCRCKSAQTEDGEILSPREDDDAVDSLMEFLNSR